MKKQILLTALTLTLLASAVMTAAAEEVVRTILFGPVVSDIGGLNHIYTLTPPGEYVADMSMRVYVRDKIGNMKVHSTLHSYLEKGVQIVFENEDMKSGSFTNERLLAIIIDGQRVELTRLFARDVIAREFPYLDKKLKAQGTTSR
jgi:hypothetical protein